jgi:AhpD family alkylhydroperoxidase
LAAATAAVFVVSFVMAWSPFQRPNAGPRRAVAVTLRCDGCINAHTGAAIKTGASKEEIVDALGVAIMVNAGATMVYSAWTIDAYDTKTTETK